MKKIRLVCCAGMSTSMIVRKMEEEIRKQDLDVEVSATSVNAALDEATAGKFDADVVLVGPQMRFALKNIQEKVGDIPVKDIDMRMYGLMDAKGILQMGLDLMEEK